EPVARPPATYLKACELGFNSPFAPADGFLERDRAGLEPEPVVFAHRLQAAAEVEPLRPGRGIEQLGKGRGELAPLLERAQQIRVRRRMDLPEQREDLLADQAADGVGVARVLAMADSDGVAVRDRLSMPERQERADDAVLAAGLDACRPAARNQAVEH